MKYIGAHVDGFPSVEVAPLQAKQLGATAFALNLSEPSRYTSAPISTDSAAAFKATCSDLGYTPAMILPHARFVINMCSPDARKLKLSRMAMIDEFNRAAMLGLTMVNFHPGSSLGKLSVDEAVALCAESVNHVLDNTEGVTAVLENTAGQGSDIGYTFGQLAAIIDRVGDKSRVGVCVDTAHAFAAGYALNDEQGRAEAWTELADTVGFERLRGMHINDSRRACGSRVDRHAPIGQGEIGSDFFAALMRDDRFDGIPLILETPDPALWEKETAWLMSQCTTCGS